jgi:hypothetical protein
MRLNIGSSLFHARFCLIRDFPPECSFYKKLYHLFSTIYFIKVFCENNYRVYRYLAGIYVQLQLWKHRRSQETIAFRRCPALLMAEVFQGLHIFPHTALYSGNLRLLKLYRSAPAFFRLSEPDKPG